MNDQELIHIGCQKESLERILRPAYRAIQDAKMEWSEEVMQWKHYHCPTTIQIQDKLAALQAAMSDLFKSL